MEIMQILSLFLKNLWVFLKPFIVQLLTEGGLLLVKYAVDAVIKVDEEMPDAEDTEKKQEAMGIVTDKLAEKGITMRESVVSGAIEAAVVKVRTEADDVVK